MLKLKSGRTAAMHQLVISDLESHPLAVAAQNQIEQCQARGVSNKNPQIRPEASTLPWMRGHRDKQSFSRIAILRLRIIAFLAKLVPEQRMAADFTDCVDSAGIQVRAGE
jgi:hypothetical protein